MKSRRRRVLLYRALREMDELKKQLEKVSRDVDGLDDPNLAEIRDKLNQEWNKLNRLT